MQLCASGTNRTSKTIWKCYALNLSIKVFIFIRLSALKDKLYLNQSNDIHVGVYRMGQSRFRAVLSYFGIKKPNETATQIAACVSDIDSKTNNLDDRISAVTRLQNIVTEQQSKVRFWQVFYKSRLSKLSNYLITKNIQLTSEKKREEEIKQKEMFKSKYNSATNNLTQGPRTKKDATFAFQEVVGLLLNSPKDVIISYNEKNELEIKVGDIPPYNITDILRNDPDFEQLQFTNEELDRYVVFLKKEAESKPRLTSSFVTESEYTARDPNKVNEHLHYAEKLAITLYASAGNATVTFFEMQNFLRNFAMKPVQRDMMIPVKKLDLLTIKELIFVIAIASHGLSKPLDPNLSLQENMDSSAEEIQVLTRGENSGLDYAVNQDRKEDLDNKRATSSSGFVSTSMEAKVAKSFGSVTTLSFLNPGNSSMGRDIQSLSSSEEKEVLFVPGMQYKVTDYKTQATDGRMRAEITAVPVRPLAQINVYSESVFNMRMSQIEHLVNILEKEMKNNLDEKNIQTYKDKLESIKMNLVVMKEYKNTAGQVVAIEGTTMQQTWDKINNKCDLLIKELNNHPQLQQPSSKGLKM